MIKPNYLKYPYQNSQNKITIRLLRIILMEDVLFKKIRIRINRPCTKDAFVRGKSFVSARIFAMRILTVKVIPKEITKDTIFARLLLHPIAQKNVKNMGGVMLAHFALMSSMLLAYTMDATQKVRVILISFLLKYKLNMSINRY